MNTGVETGMGILGLTLKPFTDSILNQIETMTGSSAIIGRMKTAAPYVASCVIISLSIASLASLCPTSYPLLYVAANVARTYASAFTTVALASAAVSLTGYVTTKDLGMGSLSSSIKPFTDRAIDQVAAFLGRGAARTEIIQQMKKIAPYVASCVVISLATVCAAGLISTNYPLLHMAARLARTYASAYTTVVITSFPILLAGHALYVVGQAAAIYAKDALQPCITRMSRLYHRVVG